MTQLKNLNKENLIQKAFKDYDLDDEQVLAIQDTVDGYVKLIEVSKAPKPTRRQVKILVDLIKSNLVNTLNVLEEQH